MACTASPSGLVVTYTTSGIFNFAHGAVAMLAAFTYWQVRFDWGWPAPGGLLRCWRAGAGAGGADLRRGDAGLGTSEVTRIVVPVSVMLGFLALATWIWDPTPRTPRLFLLFFGADKTVSIAGVNLTWHELLALVMAAVAISFFFRTRNGVAMRAVVDDPDLLELNGASRAAGHAVVGAGGVPRRAGRHPHHADPGVGDERHSPHAPRDRRLRRRHVRPAAQPAPTFLGALVLGLAGSYVIGYFPADRWTWTGNFRVSLPMIALFVVLLFLPQDRLRGPSSTARALPHAERPQCGDRGLALVGGMFLLREILAPTAINSWRSR